VEISLVAVRALVFALCVLCRVRDGLADSGTGAAGVGGQHAATPLLSDDVHRLRVLVGEDWWVRVECRMSHAHAASAYVLKPSRERVLA
jgi:hypothetical protein